MNPLLHSLHAYPFQRLRTLLATASPTAGLSSINLSIGEPKHPTPGVIKQALLDSLDGLASYPSTLGMPELRQSCAAWLARRYGVTIDPEREILPCNGSREALFSFVQAVIDPKVSPSPIVLSPNPFYQIYEGAALLAGASPWYVNTSAENNFQPDWDSVPDRVWQRTRLVFVCSPGNPTGAVMPLYSWRKLFALSDRYGFVIAADECYSEIHFGQPPLGGLEAARLLDRDFRNLVIFTSLSKRSNAPGLRSGFVAGDATLLESFLLYRTYHGSAMSPCVQNASIAAWNDEQHVESNRQAYQAKFAALVPMLANSMAARMPDAGFYLWLRVPDQDDQVFTLGLYQQQNVTVLPGSFLARTIEGNNPGQAYVRMALVAPLEQCIEAANRINTYLDHHSGT